MKRALGILVLAACNTPTPTLQLTFAGPPSQECPSIDCAEVQQLCPTVMGIRIVDPEDPTTRHLDQCTEVNSNGRDDMCGVFGVDLKPTPLPVRRLEVQVALYPKSLATVDPATGDLTCPDHDVHYSAIGFPVEQAPTPALGGHAFYRPGDSIVSVTLGCTNLAAINESCVRKEPVPVSATIEDLDTGIPVSGTSSLAVQLRVAVGEPHPQGTSHVLNPVDAHPLNLTTMGTRATWSADVDLAIMKYACIEVLEENAQTPTTVRCAQVTPGAPLDDLHGVWISRERVRKILDAVAQQSPDPGLLETGLTIGLVVDEHFNPLPNVTVMPTSGTVSYLTAEGKFVGDTTSESGLFMSSDAPFGTRFVAFDGGLQTNTGIGGLIDGKLTVVVLVAGPPP